MVDDGTTRLRGPFDAYWLIVKCGIGRTEVLTVDRGGTGSLPVFRFEEEANLFLKLDGFEREGWRVEESTAREVASALSSPSCSGVASVLLDLLPESVDLALGVALCAGTTTRQGFVDHFTGDRGSVVP
ncbi:MAG: hypothetical protein H0V53_06310 [Rubrobacter sp.]|jgi:hypothetical protein|nr:hypothetical protein [Rubrobacter sp.]